MRSAEGEALAEVKKKNESLLLAETVIYSEHPFTFAEGLLICDRIAKEQLPVISDE